MPVDRTEMRKVALELVFIRLVNFLTGFDLSQLRKDGNAIHVWHA
jgi:hypothetical protein